MSTGIIKETEVINLVMGLFSLVIFFYKRNDFPDYHLFFFGYFSIIGSLIFIVVKGFFMFEVFNFLEHFGYALAGIFFASGCYIYFIRQGKVQGKE